MKRLARHWGPVLAWAALIFTLSSLQMPSGPSRIGLDKVAHLFVFATLAALLARALSGGGSGIQPSRAVMWAIALATLYGASDEFHQRFVPGRSSDVFDLAADAAGACVGALGYQALLARSHRGARR